MLLQAILDFGNFLNSGTNRGGAAAFKLSSIWTLSGIKATDSRTSALTFLLEQLEDKQGITLGTFLRRDLPSLQQASSIKVPATWLFETYTLLSLQMNWKDCMTYAMQMKTSCVKL